MQPWLQGRRLANIPGFLEEKLFFSYTLGLITKKIRNEKKRGRMKGVTIKLKKLLVYSAIFLFLISISAEYADVTTQAKSIQPDSSPVLPDAQTEFVSSPVLSEPDAAIKSTVASSMQKLPMMFEENRGQMDKQVNFMSRGQGYAIYLAEGGAATLGLRSGGKEGSTAIVNMTPVGGRTDSKAGGVDIQQAKYHYYKGYDSSKWALNVPLYGKVAYSDIYDGIDLVYYGNPQNLEYDFVVSPGADPSVISLSFDGAQSMAINESDDLVLSLVGGEVMLKAPIAYQEKNGKRVKVDSRYLMGDSGRVAFKVGLYDKSIPLVIDPVLSYSTLLGGSSDDAGNSIAVDGAGNMYVTGEMRSADYPVTDGSTRNGDLDDVFMTKLSPTGTLLFSTLIGGSGNDIGMSIAVDDIGYIYVTGYSFSSVNDFPVTDGSTYKGVGDAFVTILSGGGTMVFSTLIGGSGEDFGQGIAVDDSRNIYITGHTKNATTDYPVTDDSTHHGADDVFVTKFSPTRTMIYSTLIGGSFADIGNDIAVDDSGHAYVTGYTMDAWESLTDYPVTDGSSHSGVSDAFVTKLSPNGFVTFSTLIGGSDSDHGWGVTVGDSGNMYVAGGTRSPDYPVTNFSSHKGNYDVFVTRLSPAGARTFSSFIGGSNSDTGHGMAVDSSGSMYVTGDTWSTGYPVTDGSKYTGGTKDVFVTRLGPDGAVTFSTLIGGSLDDNSRDIAVDDSGNMYVTGYTPDSVTDYPVTDDSTPKGGYDALVTRLSPTPDRASLVAPSGNWTNSPTYTWNAVPNATWYYLWVDDSEKHAVGKWYRASEVGCESGTVTCSIDPSTALAIGDAKWWVRTWSTVGYGVWSEGESFNVQ
ncbi:MAG: SBBP repeat-containing protein [Candidatus Thiodiazotropha sp. (ex Dulcina madagascariensis)]|nr:SBBP repeat-containing protein [Candidatus Thiodiazotropha sp. (ex Dulcina madagascariensis)]